VHLCVRVKETALQKGDEEEKNILYAFFWVIRRHLKFICQCFGTLCQYHLRRQVGTYPPMKMEQTECSETLAYTLQTPVNHPEENIQHSEHGKSLKSRKIFYYIKTQIKKHGQRNVSLKYSTVQ
jgi:hypothetical protein